MKFIQLRRSLTYGMLAIVLASSVLLASCGGGGGGGSSQSAGVGGTGIAAGKTTGFGSIYVNGSKFNTDQSTFIVDGDSFPNQLAANLQVGMYVKLKVETLDGNFTGKAREVVYDDEVQGPVAGISGTSSGETQRTFTVFGQNVTIDETSTIFNGTTFAGLSNGRLVEISGFRTSAIDITATYVEDKGAIIVGSEVELRGTVSGYVPAPEEFVIDGVTIITDGMTVKDLESGPLQNGMFVEVEGIYQVGGEVLAREIEEEDEDFGDDVDDVSLQGVISNFNGTNDFDIDGQPVDASGANTSPANALNLLANGVEVEVEGDIVGGVLIADELELREGDSELRTTISAVDPANSRFQVEYPGQGLGSGLGTIWVNTDGQTLFDDEAGVMPVENLDLNQLAIGNFVKVKGIADSGEITAEIVKRRDPNSSKLQGAVEAFNPDPFPDTSITILGITYPIDIAAEYEEGALNRVQFFGTPLQVGDIVELEDDEPDADADEVEFDD